MTAPQIKVKIQRRPTLKLKVLPKFPSSVTVESPITLDRTGGSYEFGLDISELQSSLDPLYMPTTFTQDGTGAVAVSYDSLFRKIIVTPEMFGAVAGSDATAAIQRAINYLASITGGTVKFSNRLYITSAPLVISTKGITLEGYQPATGNGTEIYFTPGTAGQKAISITAGASIASDILIKNISIRSPDTSTYKIGIGISDGSHVTLRDLFIYDFLGGVVGTITGAVANGSGEVRLTVSGASTNWNDGWAAAVSGVNGTTEANTGAPIVVSGANTIDMKGITLTNAFVAGATFTGTGSGTNLTASSVSGTIAVGSIVSGTGVPADTFIVSQSSGSAGAAGVYVTSKAITSSAASLASNGAIVASSTGIQVKGRELIVGDNVAVVANLAMQISVNPNLSTNSLDESNFSNMSLVSTGTNPVIMADNGTVLSSVKFLGTQSWGGGKDGFAWRDISGAAISEQIRFDNVRAEQKSVAGGAYFNIRPNQTLYSLQIISPLLSDRDGFIVRNTANLQIDNAHYLNATGVALNIDSTVQNTQINGSYWIAGSTATLTGQTLVMSSGKNPSTGALAPYAVYANAVVGAQLGTPAALVGTNITGTAAGLTAGTVTTNANLTGVVTSVGNSTSLGVAAVTSANLRSWLTDETGTGFAYFQGGDLGTPSAGVATNLTGTASGLTAGSVTTNANLTGVVTSVGNATSLGASAVTSANLRSWLTDESGTGVAYFQGGDLGTPSAGVLTNATGTAASLTAGTATNAVNSGIANDTATNASMFLAWVTANTGNLPLKVTSTKLTFNPSTGVLSSTSFTGAGTGLTGTAASLTAGNVTTNANLTGVITSIGNSTSFGIAAMTSANVASWVTDETGTGPLVFATAPTLTNPIVGTQAASDNSTKAASTAFVRTSSALKGQIAGLTLSNGTDATNDIDIAVGEAASTETNPVLMALSSILTKQLDAAWAVGTNAGGLDTGSIANATYHIWLIQRSDTGVVDALFSTSASAPTMPTNYDRKRRIGSIVRASAAIIAFSQLRDEFLWKVAFYDHNGAINAGGTSAETVTLTVPTGIQVGGMMSGGFNNASGTNYYIISSLDQTDTAPDSSHFTHFTVASMLFCFSAPIIRTNTSGQIRMRASTASSNAYFQTVGYVDTRGRSD